MHYVGELLATYMRFLLHNNNWHNKHYDHVIPVIVQVICAITLFTTDGLAQRFGAFRGMVPFSAF